MSERDRAYILPKTIVSEGKRTYVLAKSIVSRLKRIHFSLKNIIEMASFEKYCAKLLKNEGE